ncbi:PHP domain-containing protein [Kibdelosporangium phytohabitans]|uniref:Metal-dependent phosphoesterase n=1 Tax=Kibdelosporangium phytohabitans TaxID=860235 RepID=A0A0N9HUX6_9PSEU|nr:PHP domain-containing protein [Kibdelosporangium phytohabitans]ALG06708.1 metal-dependent phosphoesterase [Kibdelosporangium phytohabitans]MBE1467929.1 putative metal-dependent phosphoesterase TrpH [Kibdelosporangium phytohabitans]
MVIDLHTHSSVSDGTDTPTELVTTAAEAGLSVVALTDHDTTAGWVEAAAALPDGLSLVRGAELSCESPNGRGGTATVHLLAYLFDPDAPAIVAEQSRLRAERRTRLHKMAKRMAADGYPVDADELLASLPADSPAGRPHLAMALVKAGVVSSVDEAFAVFLNSRGRFMVSRRDTPVHTAIQMIADAGGVTVLAHAFAHHRGPTVTADVIKEMTAAGLTGLEVDHPDHDPATRAELAELAEDLRLVRTGSSDYHGTNKTIRIGQESTTPEALDELVSRTSGVPVLHSKVTSSG